MNDREIHVHGYRVASHGRSQVLCVRQSVPPGLFQCGPEAQTLLHTRDPSPGHGKACGDPQGRYRIPTQVRPLEVQVRRLTGAAGVPEKEELGRRIVQIGTSSCDGGELKPEVVPAEAEFGELDSSGAGLSPGELSPHSS